MHSANVRDAKSVHSLRSMDSRGFSLLSTKRTSCSRRPPPAQSKSVVGLAEVVCFVGAAARDRVPIFAANYCAIIISNCSWSGCSSCTSPDATG
jgi:hypothetical protein